MRAVTYFIADENIFTGMLPDSLRAMSRVIMFEIYSNSFNGKLPASGLRAFKHVERFKVSKNHLTGMLPDSTRAMMQLVTFLVGLNGFTGTLSDRFLCAAGLKSLDVSHNGLVGALPATLSSVSVKLELSHNDFEGSILSRIDATAVYISYNALAAGSVSNQLDQVASAQGANSISNWLGALQSVQ
eukprot:1448616-Amphidinium_carterae.1